VHSVIRAESNYNPRAVSPKGALGLMQLIPSTARRFGVSDVFDPKQNVEGGVRYLKFLLGYYQNDYPKAIAAYNAGEGAVDKYHGIPPFEETQNYVYRVARNLKAARLARSSVAEASPNPSTANPTSVETFNPIQTSVGEDGRVYLKTP
jgi:soluble lytic murein transglycosylase-like protein